MEITLDKLRIEIEKTDSELKKAVLKIIISNIYDTSSWNTVLNAGPCKNTIIQLLYGGDITSFYQKHQFEIEQLIRLVNSKTNKTIQNEWKEKKLYSENSQRTLYYNAASWFAVSHLIHHYHQKIECINKIKK